MKKLLLLSSVLMVLFLASCQTIDKKTEEIIQTLLKDKLPTPGSAKNRKNTAPEKGKTTLLEVKNA